MPSARRPISDMSHRDTYIPPLTIGMPEVNEHDFIFDEIDSIPLSQLTKSSTFTAPPVVHQEVEYETPIEITPVRQRQTRKKKSTTAGKRSSSAGRKTRKQTALEKVSNEKKIS